MSRVMRQTLNKNVNFMKKALRAKESASRVREHKDLWRIMRDSTKEQFKEAH